MGNLDGRSMSDIRDEERPGWKEPCPECGRPIKYTVFKNWGRTVPFFYSTDGTEILMRRSDLETFETLDSESLRKNKRLTTEEVEKFWRDILENAPRTAAGGAFELWNYVHCPHCKYEFEYWHSVRNIEFRLGEQDIIVLDGVKVVDDGEKRRILVRDRKNFFPWMK